VTRALEATSADQSLAPTLLALTHAGLHPRAVASMRHAVARARPLSRHNGPMRPTLGWPIGDRRVARTQQRHGLPCTPLFLSGNAAGLPAWDPMTRADEILPPLGRRPPRPPGHGSLVFRKEPEKLLGHPKRLTAIVCRHMPQPPQFDVPRSRDARVHGARDSFEVCRATATTEQQYLGLHPGERLQPVCSVQDDLGVMMHGRDEVPERNVATLHFASLSR
jgi:hypothetical protein